MALLGLVSFAGSAFALDLYKRTSKSSTASSPTAQAGQAANLSAKDKTFVQNAAKGGMMEVAMGKMAEQSGQSADVKSFGKRMVTDHSKANNELMMLAEKKGKRGEV